MIAVAGDRQVCQVQGSQITVEQLGAQGHEVVEEVVEFPEVVQIAGFMKGGNRKNTTWPLFVLQEPQRIFLKVGLGSLAVRQPVGKSNEQLADAEIGLVQVEIVAAAQHLDGITAEVAIVVFVGERPGSDLGPR